MELAFIFYLFAAFILVPGSFFLFSYFKKYIAAVIVAIALIVYFVLFGLQTFNLEGKFVVSEETSMKFPPTISMCPDMFTLYQHDNSSNPVCVETVGLGSGITTFNPNNSVTETSVPTDAMKFNLYTGTAGDKERRDLIIAQCRTKAITWEGIYDGVQSYDNVIPRPG
jgi:hypothetical protein